MPDSSAQQYLDIGDTFTAVDRKEVAGTFDFYTFLSPQVETFTVQRTSGEVEEIPASAVITKDGKQLNAWAIEPGETITFDQDVPVYGEARPAGLFYLDEATGLVTAGIWDTDPRLIELYIEIRVPHSCMDCQLKNIAVMDWGRRSWLAPVDSSTVAWRLFPTAGQPPSLMAVPPPVPLGYTANTYGTGQLSGYSQGSTFTGSYSGNAISSITPYYDYTLTNLASAYNLGAIFQQAKIEADTAARRAFVLDRYSNLRLGAFNPGEQITGYIHFAAPNGFEGPFIVALQGHSTPSLVSFDSTE